MKKQNNLLVTKMKVTAHTIGLNLVKVKPSKVIEYRERYEIIYERENFKEFIQRIYKNITKKAIS